jgi:hypothetical protein
VRPSPLFLAALTIACAVDSTEPRHLVAPPRFSSQSAPSELPNVIRYGIETGFGVIDPVPDLWVFAGFPEDLSQSEDCGGPGASFDTFYFQDAGQIKGVIHEIGKGDDVRISVYRFSTFDPCTSKPIAVGTGSVIYRDNDFFETGTGTETFGVHIDGIVTLAKGGTARVLARNLWHVFPDGTVSRVYRNVTVTPRKVVL